MEYKRNPPVTVIDSFSLARRYERMIAFCIDYVFATLLFGLLTLALKIPFIGGLLSTLYLLLRDAIPFLGHRSIGKWILGIKVVKDNDSKPGILTSIKRNIIFIPNFLLVIPGNHLYYGVFLINAAMLAIEVYLLYTSDDLQRMGDSLAETLVIE